MSDHSGSACSGSSCDRCLVSTTAIILSLLLSRLLVPHFNPDNPCVSIFTVGAVAVLRLATEALRVMGLTQNQIEKIDLVVDIAGGAAEGETILSALSGNLIDALITDDVTVRRLINT